jgi:hypothetical protein
MRKALMLWLCLGFFLQARASTILLTNSFPEQHRPMFQELASEIKGLVGDIFLAEPPLNLPISVEHTTGNPITSLDDWQNPHTIVIGITATDRYWAQFTYQLGHELGHVMLGVRRSNRRAKRSWRQVAATVDNVEVLGR